MTKTIPTLSLSIALSFILGANLQAQEIPAERLKKIDAIVNAYVEAEAVNSVAIGILDEEAGFTKGYGQLSKADSQIPDADTVFEIGSISKVFTGVLLADAISRGIAKADQPAEELLPDGNTMPFSKKKPDRKITLTHLSTHVSGLPRMPGNLASTDPLDPYKDYSANKLFEFLNSHELTRKPGIFEEYSNLGAGLLGELLAQKQNSSYEKLLLEQIAKPLGMSSTSLILSASQKARLAPPHDAGCKPVSNWNFDALAGAGGIRSTVNDMLKFARANLSPPENQIGNALELAFTQQRKSKGFNSMPMGFGWTINPSGTRWHNGETGGYHSIMFVNRKKQRALIVLCNTATPEIDKLASEIMAVLAGQDVKPRKFRKSINVPRETCQRYVGTYKLSKAISIAVAFANEEQTELTVQLTGQGALQIFPETETLWFLKAVEAEIEFEVNTEGKCTALTLKQNGGRQTAKKQ